jgi:hypothetical protein
MAKFFSFINNPVEYLIFPFALPAFRFPVKINHSAVSIFLVMQKTWAAFSSQDPHGQFFRAWFILLSSDFHLIFVSPDFKSNSDEII